MKELFDYVRDNILRGTQWGFLVTQDEVMFDIGQWIHRPYGDIHSFNENLHALASSGIYHLVILDDFINDEGVDAFMNACDFQKVGKPVKLIYCVAIRTDKLTDNMKNRFKQPDININRFEITRVHGDYTIFINDFVKHILDL